MFIFNKPKFSTYGWRRDIPDNRDFLYQIPEKLKTAIPSRVDLRQYCSPVEDQGEIGSCTANAIAAAVEYHQIRFKGTYEDISRLFVYYNERILEGTVASDSGATLRDGIKALEKWGVCAEKSWPYKVSKFRTKPSCTCYKKAKKHLLKKYMRLITVSQMKACLASGFPFVFGISVFESFECDETALTGIVLMPGPNEKNLGGHAVCAVGYDEEKKWFIVRNSWGTGWGDKGYFYLPYEYVEKLADDFWTIITQEGY